MKLLFQQNHSSAEQEGEILV